MNDSNVIIAALDGGRTTVTASRYMEDYGQVLKIEGIDLPSVYQVDFSNNLMRGTSMTVLGNADGVAIPDEYIGTGRDVYAFLYLVGDSWGRTIATIRIPNKTRPTRTDAIPTPTQQSVIDQAISALNDAVESTAADAEQTASDAARAEAARIAAETAEANAEASATAAAQSEANAAGSASTATSAKDTAVSASQTATTKATEATTAAATAVSAKDDAVSANTAAQSAKTAAQTAQTGAETAAASVAGSAAQIQTNAEDISQLKSDFTADLSILTDSETINYPDADGHAYTPADKRYFWNDVVPANTVLQNVFIPVGNVGSDAYILVDVWEVGTDGNTLNKVFTKTVNLTSGNTILNVPVNQYSEKNRYVSYCQDNVNTFYRSGQTGYTWKYSSDVSPETTTLTLSGLSTYTNMTLVGGFTYLSKKADPEFPKDFYSGWQTGNVIVFGDSTVDGSSTTDYAGNVIGTDRTAEDAPAVFTSIVENMIKTFIGADKRVYNAGFGGKTLNYIADNYHSIMAAFTNVKSALLVIDVNSASGTRSEYETNIRNGLERMINLLRADNISIAIASPQPMFYYPADDGTLPAINSAGEFAIAVNIGKDICTKYGLPFINLGEITNKVMSSPYFNTLDFYGDRIHFGDGGHKFEAYELYGELIHPIVMFDDNPIFVNVDSNMGELSATSGISVNYVNGYRSIILQADHTRTDVLHRIYAIAKAPFTLEGITVSGWTSYYDVFVDGVLYTTNTTAKGDPIPAGCHEITVKPTATGHIVRYSGLVFRSVN